MDSRAAYLPEGHACCGCPHAFLTEITSNTATATIILPVAASLAFALGIEPLGAVDECIMYSSLLFCIKFGKSGYIRVPR